MFADPGSGSTTLHGVPSYFLFLSVILFSVSNPDFFNVKINFCTAVKRDSDPQMLRYRYHTISISGSIAGFRIRIETSADP
jgi:hypothetical protein